MESWWQDLRFGFRALRRDVGFAIVAVLTLAVGIGANAAVWSIAQAAIFRSLPYESPADLLVVQRLDREGVVGPISLPEFRDISERHRAFESVGLARHTGFNISGDKEPERVQGLLASAEFLSALGVEPTHGRDFTAADDREGAQRTAIISHGLWTRRFGADPDILDRVLRVDGEQHEIVGVLPQGLGREILVGLPIGDLLVPLAHYREQLKSDDRASRLGLWAVARLAEGQDVERGSADIARISRELEEEFPVTNKDSSLVAEPVNEHVFGDFGATISALVGGALLVLLVACANLANLFLTRLARRRGELATRLALGASSSRVLRQLLTESLLLGLLGGVLGLVLAQITLWVLPRYLGGVEYLQRSQLDTALVLGAIAASLVTSLVVCVLPSLRALRRSLLQPSARLRVRGSTRAHRLRWGLISLEVAFAIVALVGAGLLLETMDRLNELDPGFDSEGVLCLDLLLPQDTFDQRERWVGFFDEVLARLSALPEVEEVALTSSRPFDQSAARESPVVAGDRAMPNLGEAGDVAFFQMVSPNYFRTLGIPLRAGRGVEARDDDRLEAESVMVISQSLADRFWPEGNAVGRRVAFEFLGTPAEPEPVWRQVVGVVGDISLLDPRLSEPALVFVPYAQVPLWLENGQSPTMTLVLRSRNGDPQRLFPAARRALLEIAPNQPVFNNVALADALRNLYGAPRQVAWLLTAFAFLAAMLVVVGVYGLVSYIVASSTHEIGIRLALGATPKTIVTAILRRCVLALLGGLVLGALLVFFFLAPLVEAQIFGVEIYDPGVLLAATSILALIGLFAALVPALRAIRITPARALRYE